MSQSICIISMILIILFRWRGTACQEEENGQDFIG
jgi:hypothetical protein